MESRRVPQRIGDALQMFKRDVDCFFATTNPDGRPNVVPLSVVWHADTFLLCTRRSTRTVANVTERPFARLVYGTARDVVLIDADCEIHELGSVARDVLTAFHDHSAGTSAANRAGTSCSCVGHVPSKAGDRNPRRP